MKETDILVRETVNIRQVETEEIMSNILRCMKEKEPGNGLESELWWVETYRFLCGFHVYGLFFQSRRELPRIHLCISVLFP